MSDPGLHQLERDVEAARAKLAGDLSTLRSPATYSEFSSQLKYEALDMKDAMVDKAKSSVQSTIDSFVEDLKARAAANPVAALAIGAGIAWRLIRRPPIATALIGAGLYGLFRTAPTPGNARTTDEYLAQAKDRLAEQASDIAGTVKDSASAIGETAAEKATKLATGVKERAMEMGEAAAEKATEFASGVKRSASSMAGAAQGKASELAGAARSQAQHWSKEVPSSNGQAAGNASRLGGHASRTLEEMRRGSMTAERVASRSAATDEWMRPIQETAESHEARDKFLLGAAGVAVIAALGIACQRRLSEPANAGR